MVSWHGANRLTTETMLWGRVARTLNLMPSASYHISGTSTTSFLLNDLLRGSVWDRPGIVAQMFTFRAVHNGPSCHDMTRGGAKKKGV